jgi:hypothetical protein
VLEPTFQLSSWPLPRFGGAFSSTEASHDEPCTKYLSATFIIGAILMVWGGIAWLLIEGVMRLLN